MCNMIINDNLINVNEKSENLNAQVKNFEKHKRLALSIQSALANMHRLKGFNNEKLEQNFTAKGLAILNCGTSLGFTRYYNTDNTTKLSHANFCKNRLCPMCAWRWHLKYNAILRRTFTILGEGDYYHLVLTIPNLKVITKDIIQQLNRKASAFIKKQFNTIDYFKGFELTIGEDGTYHPHYHIVLYYPKGMSSIPTKKEIQTNWAKLTGYGQYNIINIDKCTTNTVSIELTKYILKFENSTKEEFIINSIQTIYLALKGLRKFSTSGLVKKAEEQAKIELENENIEELKELQKYDYETTFYKWLGTCYEQSGKYQRTRFKEDN